ncbi:MAG: NADH:ubiquinone oxidoreductase [Metallosphaera sp.]|uniref:NADH-quinone oxidoreductase subunit B family protein n=1 Tax=Metallosphaera sp. TaxID=2020860 RepID=UPI00315E1589
MNWFLRGLKGGIYTEKDYHTNDKWPSALMRGENGDVKCPTDAIKGENWDAGKCVFCRLCEPVFYPTGKPLQAKIEGTEGTFKRSFFVYPIDTGSCGGCNLEFRLISAPQYDMTRFGIFFVNTPKHADALIVMGNLSEKMSKVLRKAYDVMPEPKLVILIGTCAISGGVTGIPPDIKGNVIVPGCPPTPSSILDALIAAKGDKR